MNPGGDAAPRVEQRSPDYFANLLSRRQILQRATALGLGGMVLSALPVAERLLGIVDPAKADDVLADPTLQAYADTLIPGRKALLTEIALDDRCSAHSQVPFHSALLRQRASFRIGQQEIDADGRLA